MGVSPGPVGLVFKAVAALGCSMPHGNFKMIVRRHVIYKYMILHVFRLPFWSQAFYAVLWIVREAFNFVFPLPPFDDYRA